MTATVDLSPATAPHLGTGARVLGAALGGAISFAFAVILTALAEGGAFGGTSQSGVLALVALGATIGVPVGTLLGWIFTPAALLNGNRMRLDLVVRLASSAVLFGAAIVAFTMTFDDLVSGGTSVGGLVEAAASMAMLIVVGLLYFGAPAWVLAAVVGAAWVMIVGAVAGDDPVTR